MPQEQPSYTIQKATAEPKLDGAWDGPAWCDVPALTVGDFHPTSSSHRPETRVKAAYTPAGVYIIWQVKDQYVRSTRTGLNSYVWNDAAVEWFVRPKPDKGYFNFEMNCGGHLLTQYIEDPTPKKDDFFEQYCWVPPEVLERVQIYHSLPEVVEPEIAEPVEWYNEYFIPFSLFEEFVGSLGDMAGQTWYGNFNKCAVDNSHPHWATWAPLGPPFSFHRPETFAPLTYEE